MRFDPRSLALFRMALGLVLLGQSLLLVRDFAAFYQADGVFPTVDPISPFVWFLSPQTLEPMARALLFGIIPLFAISLIFGAATRLSTLVCFVALVMVQGANPQIQQGGDVLLRLLLFWSLFLPLGQSWSMDARSAKSPSPTLPWTTEIATWALTLQICLVYWFAALLKSSPLWTSSGDALFYALNIEHFTTPFGLYLRQFPDLLRGLTFGTLGWEVLGPCLLFVPFHRDYFRLAAVGFFLGFHLIGMQALLRIGLFPWVCATAWLVFIPGRFWEWLTMKREPLPKFKRAKSKGATSSPKKEVASLRTGTIHDYSCCALVMISLLDVLIWNIASVRGDASLQWMKQHDVWGNFLRLDQRWNMYAPYPRDTHGWLVVPAELTNGNQVDLFTGQPVSWDKPQDIGAYLGDDRWRRYLSNLFDYQDAQTLQGYADYLVRRWNQIHGIAQQVQVVTIVFMKQVTLPDLTVTPPEKEVLYFRSY